ncbi:MAG: hypothetical protein IH899_19955 [Planctomycetes bacterium]|nr:hypothetical protein [Planctomycetota bacterium]
MISCETSSDTRVYQTDWLASNPVFFNEKTGAVSQNVNDVIDYSNVEFHPEGLRNYLDFGFSVFGQTPIRHVRFLRHSSRLRVDVERRIEIEHLPDPVDDWMEKLTKEDDVIQLIEQIVGEWEESQKGEIVIPTSGGFDSRLLNLLIRDKSRIRSFSFGLSKNQSKSSEVVYARALSKILKTRWEQIPLGKYHRYIDDWLRLYGISTHAHGMYHIEFYRQLRNRTAPGSPVLSGFIGDPWAGSVDVPELQSEQDLFHLGYSHGMRADSKQCLLPDHRDLRSIYWNENKERLKKPRFRIVEAMRMKIILLSYLINVPRSLGFKAFAPFIIPEISLGMLMLPDHRRKNRTWQTELFRKNGIDLESQGVKAQPENTLNLQAIRLHPPQPLDRKLLREVINPDYVDWINRGLRPAATIARWCRGAARRLRMKRLLGRWGDNPNLLTPYFAYLCLKPIERVLQSRQ